MSAASLLLAPVAARADQAATTTHVVQPGETLAQIAESLGVEPATLVVLNGLDDANVLLTGQSLKVPGAAAPAAASSAGSVRTYTVADGDTLWSIAQQFATTTDALTQANHLDDPDHLVLGAQLTVPTATEPSAAAPAPAPRPAAAQSPPAPAAKRTLLVSYTVQPGETLSRIARRFDVRADAIVQSSGLEDPNKLSIGSVLKVPAPAKEHIVAAGETLRDIALQEKVDLGSLVDFNQLDDPELIRVGQVVVLPVPANAQADAPQAPAAGAAGPPTGAPAAALAPGGGAAAPAASSGGSPAAPPPASAQAAPQGGAATPKKAAAAAKPAAPVAVVAPPKGAPTDGLVGAGLKLLGSPYVWGGSSPSGFDCSGFVWYVARQAGKPLSRGMLGEYNSGAHPTRDELKPGDLVFFQNTYSPGLSHNGIYIGNGQFVHAADEAAGVTISSLGAPYWSSHWFGATRVP